VHSFTVNEKGELALTVSLTDALLEAHAGEELFLYELRPGETLEDVLAAPPLATQPLRAWTHFTVPRTDGERNRLYSSFYVRFSGGTPLRETAFYLTDPTSLATTVSQRPQYTVAKGLNVTSDALLPDYPNADYAVALGATKGQLYVSLSSLMPGNALNQTALAALDAEVGRAYHAGLSLSLTVCVDTALTPADTAILFDRLAERYATSEERGIVDALLLSVDATHTPGEAAFLSRMATIAFVSRNAATDVYVVATDRTVEETKQFFSEMELAIAADGALPRSIGIGLAPTVPSSRAWEKDDTDAVTIHDIAQIAQYLTKANGRNGRKLAVTDIRIPTGDAEDMTASLVYAYRTAVAAGADLFFYASIPDGVAGLRTLVGGSRPLETAFAAMDRAGADLDRICLRAMGEAAFATLPEADTSRLDTVGFSSLGSPSDNATLLFDFSLGDDHGFSPVGKASIPSKHDSSAWNEPVLYTWLNPAVEGVPNGIRRTLGADELPRDATVLSMDLLTQLPNGIRGSLRLTLAGQAYGGRLVHHTATYSASATGWQTVDFGVSEFLSEITDDSPVLLTLEVLPDEACDSSYVLWVRRVRTVVPTAAPSTDWVLLAVILGTVGGVCILSLLLYRLLSKRRERRDSRR
jgi:hypothetical protein